MEKLYLSNSFIYDANHEYFIELLNEGEETGVKYEFIGDYEEKTDGRMLDDEIRKKIEKCRVIIIPAWVYPIFGLWVNKEIEIAKEKRIPIIVIRRNETERVPAVIKHNSDFIVNFNAEEIRKAIEFYRKKDYPVFSFEMVG